MGDLLLTGATGFVGQELLVRLLERGDRHVHALVRAEDDEAAAARLPRHARLSAWPADIERAGLGLDGRRADALAERVSTVIHCAASVSFSLGLDESRRVNVDGTRRMAELAERCARRGGGLERFSYVSTAYVAGAHNGAFGEDDLDVGQDFRNPYERSKFEAERLLRERAAALPLQVLRPSIVVGDSRTGWTSSFNVLYPPLRAFARGAVPALPARRRSPVDVVPVDYVADAADRLAREGPDGTFHLVAGRNATTVGRLMELASRRFQRPAPPVFPPRLYRRLVHPLLLPRLSRARRDGLRRMEVYFPYFSMRVRFADRRHPPAPPVERYFERVLDFAEHARWGRRPVERPPAAGVVPLSA
ncbi:MAG: SDR family oxidoreductase [Thermoleophilaceae bacterium]|nr:SDR family oxidoreductase [Thermoleophilaceae bacterium]